MRRKKRRWPILTDKFNNILHQTSDLFSRDCEDGESDMYKVEAIVILLREVFSHIPNYEFSPGQRVLGELSWGNVESDNL